MPRYLLLLERAHQDDRGTDALIAEWTTQGLAAGVVQDRAVLGPTRLRVIREGGVTVAVSSGVSTALATRLLVFEAEDEMSALAWAASCPGHGAFNLFRLDGLASSGLAPLGE